jgi:outer membrane protein OmpA-like peptidoglycan-associated protein
MSRNAILLALVLFCLPSFALAEIGRIKRTNGDAFVERGNARLTAKAGMTVNQRDILVTGGDGRITVTFIDNSRFSTGPDSRINLQKFQFNETTHEGAFDVTIEEGTVAIVSGQIAANREDAMQVRTPTSILGVRGTRFIVQVQPALVLLPNEQKQDAPADTDQDKQSALAVLNDDGGERSVVTGDYAVAKLGSQQQFSAQTDTTSVDAEHGDLIGNIPQQPSTYRLFFEYGEAILTPASEEAIKMVFADVEKREQADVVVTGHTDRSGTVSYNDRLSYQRAQQIKTLLEGRGMDGTRVRVAGRGEREPLVPTPDGEKEDKNRRVEITVR